MDKKIDKSTIEEIKVLCYDVLLLEPIDEISMREAKKVTDDFLNSNGYKITKVKCDTENNTPYSVDSGRVLIHIWEANDNGKDTFYEIVL